MNSFDIVIILIVVAVAVRGVTSGFLRQAGSLGGFALGLVAGAALAPSVADFLGPNGPRPFMAIVVFFTVATLIAGLGEVLGGALSGVAHKYRLGSLDSILGATFGSVITLAVIWMLASAFATSFSPEFAKSLQNSRIIGWLDQTLPPAPDVVARLERTLGGANFPRVFAGLEPAPAAPVTGPNAEAVNAAAAAGRAATVRVESLGCGALLEGTGFVVGPGLVATNAHVVAGVRQPVVVDAAGSHRASVVVFNPDLDFAVLRTTGLAAAPLPLAQTVVDRGTMGAVLGYPGGGSFTVSPAAVLGRQTALGRTIYDTSLTRRNIYSLQTVVRPGNSGGPLITPEGTVIGVVFAMSTTNNNVGYALTSTEVLPDVARAATAGTVSTGACLK